MSIHCNEMRGVSIQNTIVIYRYEFKFQKDFNLTEWKYSVAFVICKISYTRNRLHLPSWYIMHRKNRKGVIKLLLHFYLRVLQALSGSPHYAKIVISKSTSAHVFLTISMSNYRPPNITVSVNFREYHNNDR